jgi:hypothetical protein
MRNLFISLIAVTFIQTILNYPPPQPVQATPAELPLTSNKAVKAPEKKKVVKDATPKKKTVSKPLVPSRAISKPKPVRVSNASGSCADWMARAGVGGADADFLILHESGCRPDAINPSSGACGIPQALPCSKMNCTLQDPVCQLRWMSNYVTQRYGSWRNARVFWEQNNWY